MWFAKRCNLDRMRRLTKPQNRSLLLISISNPFVSICKQTPNYQPSQVPLVPCRVFKRSQAKTLSTIVAGNVTKCSSRSRGPGIIHGACPRKSSPKISCTASQKETGSLCYIGLPCYNHSMSTMAGGRYGHAGSIEFNIVIAPLCRHHTLSFSFFIFDIPDSIP
ncbi:hypothetical protein BDR06DRAFT_144988 [Suillus hirtellus]|nr:hypothetical protein BDR06DRAFT_144988 [Suillus hirtellus]